MLSMPATVHPISGLRLLRARLPAEELSALRWIPATSVRVLPPPEEKLSAARRAAEEEIKGPVRIRLECEERNLVAEEEEAAEEASHHLRRMEEEIAAVRNRFAGGRIRARNAFFDRMSELSTKYSLRAADYIRAGSEEKLAALMATLTEQQSEAVRTYRRQLDERFSPNAEAMKIAGITNRRTPLMWSCPNDGQAHPFEWQGYQYHRMYTGEMWRSSNWCWAGRWTGYYITSSPAPLADSQQKSTELRAALKC
jgi:hypothetical protein